LKDYLFSPGAITEQEGSVAKQEKSIVNKERTEHGH
jgi:hypothetical protein